MGSRPTIAGVYHSPYGNSIAELLMRQGDIAARGAENKGAIWANALGQVGQIAAGAVQDYQAKQEQKKRDDALMEFVNSGVWAKDPQAALTGSVAILGPAGVKFAEGLISTAKMGQIQNDPESAMKLLPGMAGGLMAAPASSRPMLWGGVVSTLEKAGVVKPGELSTEWNEAEHLPLVQAYAPKEKAPEGFTLSPGETRYGPDGKPIASVAPKPAAPEAPPKVGTFEAFVQAAYPQGATPQQLLQARAQWEAAGRAPKEPTPPKEYTLNPEGVVLSSYGAKEKDTVRKQAVENGLPVFENVTAQQKGVTLAGIVAEAKELQALLSLDKVKAAIGPASGRWTQLKGRLVDLDPDVQRAFQLLLSLSDTELRKRSGAQINDKEMQRLLKFTTDPNRPLGFNTVNLAGMLNAAARDYKALSGIDLGIPEEQRVPLIGEPKDLGGGLILKGRRD